MAESRTYDLKDFDALNVTTGVRAIVTTGAAYAVRIEARDSELLEKLDVSVTGGRLHIGFARNFIDYFLSGAFLFNLGGDIGVTAYVELPALNGAEANSGGRIDATNIKSERFNADASSGAQITLLGVSGGDYRLTASSGAKIEIEGTANEIDATSSSGARIRADKLLAERGRLDASSGAALDATVSRRVRAHASSGGHVDVSGNPGERDTNASSGGRVDIR